MIVLTNKIIDDARTQRGSWTRKQLELLGVAWPPREGWKFRIIGIEYDEAVIEEFRASSTIFAGKSRKNQRNCVCPHCGKTIG